MPASVIDKKAAKAEKAAKKAAKAERKSAKAAKAERKAAKAAKAEQKEPSAAAEPAAKPVAAEPSARPTFSSFADAPFDERLVVALKAAGYTAPTPIQSEACPVALAGMDLIAVAKTGSGKTLAFLLPVLDKLSKGPKARAGAPRALVLAPTRELAQQIGVQAERYSPVVGCSSAVVYGGAPLHEQKAALNRRPPELLVGTPGRLKDFLDRGDLQLSE